jgi:iron complex outermembrane receptor protein
MKKTIFLSVACAMALNATDLGTIEVIEAIDTKIIENVSNEEVKSADIAETLYKQVPSINLIRRSGIANDITLRGQKRDNITVLMDGAKICGACPNRMDLPTSHIVTANVDTIKVSEGPFDVENFGTLSGSVKIKMKKPSTKLKGNIETTLGGFGYKKFGANLSGGNDKVQILVTGSTETSKQYKDGNGNTMAQQLKNATDGTMQVRMQLANKYKDMDAYIKKTFMIKAFVKITDNQGLEFSYTKNKSDNILYGNSKMDALYDDSDIINLKYSIKELSKYSKKLTIKAYDLKVTHPMSTKYRKSSGLNSTNKVISKLTTDMAGFKVINDMQIEEGILTLGIDTSIRNWNGSYIGYGTKIGVTNKTSINNVDTKNNALFLKYNKNIDNINLKFGVRYNYTTINTANITYNDRDFNSVDANILATLKTNQDTKYFIGIGKASRVPDGRELYFNSSKNVMSGTPTLNQTTNIEIDLGVEKKYTNGYIKFKTFYSKLYDYIYFNKDKSMIGNAFENIDATIYGLELMSSYDINNNLYLDTGISYKKGKKDKALNGQSDTNLADITPLKINLALNYDYEDSLSTKVELIHANSWDNYDTDNGEQKLPSYDVVNLKIKKEFTKKFEATLGIDNLFDKTYTVSNTYADLILLSDGTSGEIMLLNEPGRYIYINLKYKF